MQQWWVWVILAYVAGSVPFGLLIGLSRGVDLRKVGSGNLGATNTMRVLGKKAGITCFLLDVMKGLLPVLVGGLVIGYAGKADLAAAEAGRWLAIAFAAVLGHIFPVWLKFKGGKGVATGFGTLLGIWPILTLAAGIALVLWIALLKAFKYVSLSSMAAACSLPITTAIYTLARGEAFADRWPFVLVTGMMALLVVVRHRTNIQRLMQGTESKVGAGKQRESEESAAPEQPA